MINEENKAKEEVLKDNMGEIPSPLISESKLEAGLTVNIFDLDLNGLIFEKMYLMFQKLNPAKKSLLLKKNAVADKRNELLRTVDFKAELNITTKPTKDDKEAVIAPMLKPLNEEISGLEDAVIFYTDKLVILNDLIKQARLTLKIEAELGDD